MATLQNLLDYIDMEMPREKTVNAKSPSKPNWPSDRVIEYFRQIRNSEDIKAEVELLGIEPIHGYQIIISSKDNKKGTSYTVKFL